MSTKIPDGKSDWLDSIVLMRVTVADPEYCVRLRRFLWICKDRDEEKNYELVSPDSQERVCFPSLLWSCNVAWMRLLLLPPGLVLASFENALAQAFCSRGMCRTSYSPKCPSCFLFLSRVPRIVWAVLWFCPGSPELPEVFFHSGILSLVAPFYL